MLMRSMFSVLGSFVLAIGVASAGCAVHDHDQDHETNACSELRAATDDDNAMPAEVRAYLAEHAWSDMHLDFHVARMWDVLGEDTQRWAEDQGISRWKLQEGQPTTGLEFLAMHRLMLTELREKFPQHAALFEGWMKPPTDLDDAAGPLPPQVGAFRPEMIAAIDRLHTRLDTFTSDDELALFLQTNRRPTADDPQARTPDRSAGLHNYVHNRWMDPDSPINVGDPALNLGNQVFWRIHGWVDSRWTAYREAKGLDDTTDEVYRKAMDDAQVWMDDVMARSEHTSHKGDDACEKVPDEVRNLFSE